MPLIRVRYMQREDLPELSDDLLMRLGPFLRAVVTVDLSSTDKDGALTSDDIEVHFDEASQFDSNTSQLTIDLEGMDYPVRSNGNPATGERNFKARIRAIGHKLCCFLPAGVTFGIWPKLVRACYFEGVGLCEQASGTASADSVTVGNDGSINAGGEVIGRVPDSTFA